jgi:glycosyltransferase involved in cell wall biosynthesis
VLSLHGEDATALPQRHPRHYESVVPLTSVVAVPSRYLGDHAARLGFPADRIRVLPSGVDTRFFTPEPPPAGPPVVAHIGRLVPKKGLDVLLAAWPAVIAAVPDAQLHVLGAGPLQHLLADAGPSVVHHLPDPSRRADQVRDLLRSASVVASPSRTAPDGDAESLLLVNIEAMASGRPVVTTRHGGIPEYVRDGDTGLLVAEGDERQFAAALRRVLQDQQLAARLAAAGVDAASALDVRRCTAAVDALYDELSAK